MEYDEVHDLLVQMKELEDANEKLVADNCYLRQEIRGLKKRLLNEPYKIIKDSNKYILQLFDTTAHEYCDFIIINRITDISDADYEKIVDYIFNAYIYGDYGE